MKYSLYNISTDEIEERDTATHWEWIFNFPGSEWRLHFARVIETSRTGFCFIPSMRWKHRKNAYGYSCPTTSLRLELQFGAWCFIASLYEP